jgi:hypothetical protein
MLRLAAVPGAGLRAAPAGLLCVLLLSASGCTQPAATITSPGHTIFDNGGATLQLTSPESSFTWTATDINGVPVGSGSVSSSPGSLTLPAVGPGWYGLRMTTPSGATLNSAFSVVANATTPNSATPNPFGSNMHPYTPSSNAVADAEVAAIAAGGLGSMRIDVRWEQVEKTKGVYTWYAPADRQIAALQSAGIRPLIVLGYANPLYDGGRTPSTAAGIAAYAAHAAAIAQHYGANVDYGVFNEYNVAGTNNSACGTTADCYYALLGPTANAIHAAVPGARVVGPTLGGFTQDWIGSAPASYDWLKRLLDLGGLAYLDAVDIHNYTWPVVAPPEGNNEAVIGAVRSLLATYSGGASKPLWLTETGWPTFPNVATELAEAQYVVRDAALSLRAGIAQYMFYDVMDDCADAGNANGQCHFGLLRHPDVSGGAVVPKPAFTAYAVVARKLAGYSYSSSENWGSGVYSLAFVNGGATRRVAWAPAGNVTLAVQSGAPLTVTSWSGQTSTLNPVGGIVTLGVGPDALYVDGSGISGAQIAAAPAFTATPPATVHKSQSVPVAISVNGSAGGAATGALTFHSDYGDATLNAVAGSTVNGTLTLSAFPNTGPVTVPIEVRQGSVAIGRLMLTMNIVP